MHELISCNVRSHNKFKLKHTELRKRVRVREIESPREQESERDGERNNSVQRWYISVIKFTHCNFRGFMKISDQFTALNMGLSAIVFLIHADGSRMEDTGQSPSFAYSLIYVIRIHSDSIKMINTLFVRDNIWLTPWRK